MSTPYIYDISHVRSRGITATIVCPGPIATGTEGTPRNVFGAEKLTAKHEERGGARKRLAPPRVAELIARAAYNRTDVAWIARHPVLLLGVFLMFFILIKWVQGQRVWGSEPSQIHGSDPHCGSLWCTVFTLVREFH